VDLCSSDSLWGLSNRCVGFESVALISDVLKLVKPSLVSLTTSKDGPSKEVNRHVSFRAIYIFFDLSIQVSAFYSQFVEGRRVHPQFFLPQTTALC
jgi:hypothetical protein